MAEIAASNGGGILGLQADNTSTTGAPRAGGQSLKLTDGWYIAIACTAGIVTADTKIGPLISGILTIGLIYQLTLLIQGK